LVEKAGRRILLLVGMLVMVIALVIMTVALVLQSSVSWLSYISIVTMVAFVIGFAVGLGECVSNELRNFLNCNSLNIFVKQSLAMLNKHE